jgi:type II secretory pathway pseudopilin PulG
MTKDPNQPDYIIRKRRTAQWYWAWTLIIFIVLLAAMALGYWLNKRQHGLTATAKEQFQQLRLQLDEAQSGQTHWQQQYQIEHEITQQLKTELDQMHRENKNLEKEREALQRIFDPDTVESGLQVASFVWQNEGNNLYQYRLMLIQAKRQTENLEGTIKISVVGEEAGQRKSYSFDEIKGTDNYNSTFDFTYVSTHTGSFQLPEGFEPKFVRVVAATTGRGAKSILQDFTWKPTNKSDEVEETNAKK